MGWDAGCVRYESDRFCRTAQAKKTLVIDMSLSKVARGKILFASQQGHPIPEG